MADKTKIVWILGSGFSKPLGGPLLDELITAGAVARFVAHCGTEHQSALTTCLQTYEAPRRGEKFIGSWSNAEEFLEFLESGVDGNKEVESILKMLEASAAAEDRLAKTNRPIGTNAKALRDSALLLVAGGCSLFCKGVTPDFERWQPYLRWASMLQPTDTVITFNYDPVIERLAAWRADWAKEQKRSVEGEIQVLRPLECKAFARDKGTPVFKLHGSVTWKFDRRQGTTPNSIEDAPEDEWVSSKVAIATPGHGKAQRVATAFADAWQAAEEAIKEAHAIIFIGYRFPQSDAVAKHRLLEAIGNHGSNALYVRTVLGPDIGDKDTTRLRKLLGWSLRKHQQVTDNVEGIEFDPIGDKVGNAYIFSEPLWAEDFLTVFSREGLSGPKAVLQRRIR